MIPGPLWQLRRTPDLPPDLEWLGPEEKTLLARLRVAKRRRDWLLGRWTAKTLLAEMLHLEVLSDLEVLPRSNGSPAARLRGEELEVSLSLSHRAGFGFSALNTAGAVGCDIELVEERSSNFIDDYFDREERALIAAAEGKHAWALVNGLWSAKESVLKLLGKGLTIDTLQLSVRPSQALIPSSWRKVAIREGSGSRNYQGWWRLSGALVLTIVTDAASAEPVEVAKVPEGGGEVPAS